MSDLPPDANKVLDAWISDNNLPVDDPDTSGDLYAIEDAGVPNSYLADYTGDDPDQFRAMVVIQKGKIIGDSVDVAS